jgi:hypothetical protein
MKFQVIEEYVDCLCPSGDNDQAVRHETIDADSEQEARELYEISHSIGVNNQLRVRALN